MSIKELNTQVLVYKVMIAVAWCDGEISDTEKQFLIGMVSKLKLSESRKATLLLEIEYEPGKQEVRDMLDELSSRARHEEIRTTILALTDRLIAADKKMDVSEISFREEIEKTLHDKGNGFFSVLKNRIKDGKPAT